MIKTIKGVSAATLFALGALGGFAVEPSLALADDDVDLYCFEYTVNGKVELECSSFEDLRAECKLTDPETTTDVCQDVNASKIERPTKLLGR
ncbi:hypothetical protein [Nitratireductor sp. GCM10026969]|uniref:hypothetical protein n=1 Tax=Nitratireductor sp. GCM10026969 TaxID=3252645 RepID=UPI00360E5589